MTARTVLTAIVVACVLATLGAAPPAPAATPFNAGSGERPGVAVAADGRGHVVWMTEGSDTGVGYCRVAPGAETCELTSVLDFGAVSAQPTGNPRVFTPAPGRVVVVAGCRDCGAGVQHRAYRWTSVTGGATWTGPVLVSAGPSTDGFGTWLDDLGIWLNADRSWIKATDGGAVPGDGVQYASGGLFVFGPEVVRRQGTNKLVAAVNDLDRVKFGVYTSATGTVAAFNNAANWLGDRTLPAAEPDISETALNSGPNGIGLTYLEVGPGLRRVLLRRFDDGANTFGAPQPLESTEPVDTTARDPDSFQDASGRVHVVWATGHDGGRLRYRVSDAGLGAFGAPGNIAVRESFVQPEVAAGPDGRGFATWTNHLPGPIRVVALDPQPEPASAPPPAPAPPVTGPAPIPMPRSPVRTRRPSSSTYTGARRAATTRVPGASIAFGVPRGCVDPGQRFTVTLRWKKQRRKGSRFVKVRRADFFLAARRVRIDRTAPFAHTMTVTASTRRGSTLTLRARAFIKVRRGRGPKKSIRATVRVCG